MHTNDTTPYWDLARLLVVERGSQDEEGKIWYTVAPLDPGINFFVLALEELGATTQFSCEGHPYGAYVSFKAPVAIGRAIYVTRTFELMGPGPDAIKEDDIGDFAIYANAYIADHREHSRQQETYTEEMRARFLREAASTWMHHFGHRLPKLKQQLKDIEARYLHVQPPDLSA